MRLYDETDVGIAFRDAPDRPDGALLVLRFEGDDLAGRRGAGRPRRSSRRAGGRDLGPALAERWWEHRNDAVATFRQIMLDEMLGPVAAVDTMEIAGLWPVDGAVRIGSRRARRARGRGRMSRVPSRTRREPCLYFTFVFVGSTDEGAVEARYRAAWNAAAAAALAAGATVTHHHGVGLLKAEWLARGAR